MILTGVKIPSGSGSFLLVRRQEVGSFRLSETIYAGEVNEPDHSHDRPYLEIILKGMYADDNMRQSVEHHSLSVAYQPAVPQHSSRIGRDGLHSIKVEMTAQWLDNALSGLDGARPWPLGLASNHAFGTLPSLGIRMYEEWKNLDEASPLAIEGLALEMIAGVVRAGGADMRQSTPLWLRQVDEFIRENFTAPLTLQSVAEIARIHPVYLARVFRRKHQCSVGEYVRRLRISHACQQITTTDLTLAEIALGAGFADQSHFCKAFKRTMGVAPGTVRRAGELVRRKTKDGGLIGTDGFGMHKP